MLINSNIEAKEMPNGNYEISFMINNQRINIKFDPGASNTIISAKIFNADITEGMAEKIIERLENIAREKTYNNDFFPFKKIFSSATGDNMIGYLADAGCVKLGQTNLEHFYYYFVPQNKRALALIGNNFLRYCEYYHSIEGSVFITKINMSSYQQAYSNAISEQELTNLIDEVVEEYNDKEI